MLLISRDLSEVSYDNARMTFKDIVEKIYPLIKIKGMKIL